MPTAIRAVVRKGDTVCKNIVQRPVSLSAVSPVVVYLLYGESFLRWTLHEAFSVLRQGEQCYVAPAGNCLSDAAVAASA